jgi:hypothetical protein
MRSVNGLISVKKMSSPKDHDEKELFFHRYALLVGNNQYTNIKVGPTNPELIHPLQYSVINVQCISEVLEELGFDIRSHTNVDNQSLKSIIRDFLSSLHSPCLALVYLNGYCSDYHGCYAFLPIDYDMEKHYNHESYSSFLVMDHLSREISYKRSQSEDIKYIGIYEVYEPSKFLGAEGYDGTPCFPEIPLNYISYKESIIASLRGYDTSFKSKVKKARTTSIFAECLLKYLNLNEDIETIFRKVSHELSIHKDNMDSKISIALQCVDNLTTPDLRLGKKLPRFDNLEDRVRILESWVAFLSNSQKISRPDLTVPQASSTSEPLEAHESRRDIDPEEEKEIILVQKGRDLFDRYITERQSELQALDWIALYDNDYSTTKVFKTAEEASEYCRGHKQKFYRQYYGPNISGDRLYPVVDTQFGRQNQGRHPMYAYVEARIYDPEDEKSYQDVEFMIDTGAVKCLGRRNIPKTKLKLEMSDIGLVTGLGGQVNIIYVETKIGLKGLDGTYLSPRVTQIGYQVKKSPPSTAEDWLLGQNYLGLYKHLWLGHQNVQTQDLPPPP